MKHGCFVIDKGDRKMNIVSTAGGDFEMILSLSCVCTYRGRCG